MVLLVIVFNETYIQVIYFSFVIVYSFILFVVYVSDLLLPSKFRVSVVDFYFLFEEIFNF